MSNRAPWRFMGHGLRERGSVICTWPESLFALRPVGPNLAANGHMRHRTPVGMKDCVLEIDCVREDFSVIGVNILFQNLDRHTLLDDFRHDGAVMVAAEIFGAPAAVIRISLDR